MIDRRDFLAASVACAAVSITDPLLAAVNPVAEPMEGFALVSMSQRVFKRTDDQNRLQREYWYFVLLLNSNAPAKPVFETMTITYFSGGEVKRVTHFPKASVLAMDLIQSARAADSASQYSVAAFQIADAAASSLQVDAVRCELTSRDANGKLKRVQFDSTIDVYVQKTALIFPFIGPGMISQGGAWNDGHRNRSGMFAIDAIGLTDMYAPMLADNDTPQSLVGWGREIIAPASGIVVVARNDCPDQPVTGNSDPAYFVAEHPQGGDPGNHCVIDHGNGEFSMLAHFKSGSLRVAVGDKVTQGKTLGLLGNSGDTNTPHVHHQLQSAVLWTDSDALPHSYSNGPEKRHNRGEMFNAKAHRVG